MMKTHEPLPKHRQIYQALERDIRAGRWNVGERMPSEAELVRAFGVSRITVGRALRDLQAAGLVTRRAGAGTYVAASREGPTRLSFGLLIPDLGETEIFELICQGMMASPLAREHALLWGSTTAAGGDKEARAWALCRHYCERGVDGVFFAPLELVPGKDETNRRIVQALEKARIPIVLLDRPALPYPDRCAHDLVGIDNRRAGYVVTEHLLALGGRRIAFLALPYAAATVDAREAGYREALYRAGVVPDRDLVWRLDPAESDELSLLMKTHRPEAIVCANDRTAAGVMHELLRTGRAVPDDVRIVGIDDLEYAKLLPVPLTTYRQPTREIGSAAMSAMLERIAQRDCPTRDVLLHGELVVRRSSGAILTPAASPRPPARGRRSRPRPD